MKGNRIITIGRQIGSGGSEIGTEVAKRLGIKCYDKQLIELACNYGELDQDVLAAAEEEAAKSVSLLRSAADAERQDRPGHCHQRYGV